MSQRPTPASISLDVATPLRFTDWHGEAELVGLIAVDFESRKAVLKSDLHRDDFSRGELAAIFDLIIATDACEVELTAAADLGLSPLPGLDVPLLQKCIDGCGVYADARPQARAAALAARLHSLAKWRAQFTKWQAAGRELAQLMSQLPPFDLNPSTPPTTPASGRIQRLREGIAVVNANRARVGQVPSRRSTFADRYEARRRQLGVK